MTLCIILILLSVVLVWLASDEVSYRLGSIILAGILSLCLLFTVAFREEKGKEIALKAFGCTPYTKTELYNMSEKEKDNQIKTYSFWSGTIYWKIDEQSTK